jgi:hypothetical protein
VRGAKRGKHAKEDKVGRQGDEGVMVRMTRKGKLWVRWLLQLAGEERRMKVKRRSREETSKTGKLKESRKYWLRFVENKRKWRKLFEQEIQKERRCNVNMMKEKEGSGEKLSYKMRRTWDSKIKPKDSISISTLPPQRKTARSGSAFLTVEKVIW